MRRLICAFVVRIWLKTRFLIARLILFWYPIPTVVYSTCSSSPLRYTFELRHDKTNKMRMHPANNQISLGIRPVWSESSLSAWRNLGSSATHWLYSEHSDQTERMPRLIWVFAGRTLILLVLSCRGSFMINHQTVELTTLLNMGMQTLREWKQHMVRWFLLAV